MEPRALNKANAKYQAATHRLRNAKVPSARDGIAQITIIILNGLSCEAFASVIGAVMVPA